METFICFDTGIFIPIGGGTVKRYQKVESRNLDQIKELKGDVRSFFFFDQIGGRRTNLSVNYIVDGKVFTLEEFEKEAKKQKGFSEKKLKEFLSSLKKKKVKQVVLDKFGEVFAFNPKLEEVFLTSKS